jgi:hypothetical protein
LAPGPTREIGVRDDLFTFPEFSVTGTLIRSPSSSPGTERRRLRNLTLVGFGGERSPPMRPTNRLLVLALIAAVAIVGLVFVLHYVPFYALSFLAWTAIAATPASLGAPSGTTEARQTLVPS